MYDPSMKASLIIPTLDRQEQVRTVVAALRNQTFTDFETIIIDQTDQPDSVMARIAAESEGRIRYLQESRKSLPNARNIGYLLARGEILIYIDDDVELSPEFVASHVAAISQTGADAIAGRITGGYDDGPPGATPVGWFSRLSGRIWRNFHVTESHSGLNQIPGGNFSVRRHSYKLAGGFDADGFSGTSAFGEESDFSLRLIANGGRIAFEPAAHLIHLHLPAGGCRDRSLSDWTYWHGHNLCLLFGRHGAWWAIPFHTLKQVARYIVHGLRAKSKEITLAGWSGMIAGMARALTLPPPAQRG